MRQALIAICGIALLAGTMGAEAPTTQPDRRPTTQRDAPGAGRRLTREELMQAQRFAEQQMPALFKLASGQEQPRRFRLWHYAAVRRRFWQQANNDPVQLEQASKSLAAEDAIFATIAELEAAPADQKPVIRQKLREQTAAVVDALLAERTERIARLKARLAEEERRLNDDSKSRERLIDRRMERLMMEESPTQPSADEPDPAVR